MKAAILVLLALFAYANADTWAVLVAGSDGYWNYRHQADVAHSYQILHSHGVPDDHIVVFMFDDLAHNSQNPFPGKLFNKPSEGPGVDVYAGVPHDYTGADVTPANFLNVLEGKADAMSTIGSHKVLKSGPEDTVFIFFSDHGSEGMICFPNGNLYANDFMAALTRMHEKNAYKQMVIYIEACYSGSMFENLLDPKLRIYATTAANGHESSWGCYCGSEATVEGKSIGSCLGDAYSINWMEDSDVANMNTETVKEQYEKVKKLTTRSEVCQFGDLSISEEVLAKFQASGKSNLLRHSAAMANGEAARRPTIFVDSRDAKMEYMYHLYMTSKTDSSLIALMDELKHRKFADVAFTHMASVMFPSKGLGILDDPSATRMVDTWDCYKNAVAMAEYQCGKFSDYSLKYVPLLSAACQSGASVPAIIQSIVRSCRVNDPLVM